jgi:hypothetical protein
MKSASASVSSKSTPSGHFAKSLVRPKATHFSRCFLSCRLNGIVASKSKLHIHTQRERPCYNIFPSDTRRSHTKETHYATDVLVEHGVEDLPDTLLRLVHNDSLRACVCKCIRANVGCDRRMQSTLIDCVHARTSVRPPPRLFLKTTGLRRSFAFSRWSPPQPFTTSDTLSNSTSLSESSTLSFCNGVFIRGASCLTRGLIHTHTHTHTHTHIRVHGQVNSTLHYMLQTQSPRCTLHVCRHHIHTRTPINSVCV